MLMIVDRSETIPVPAFQRRSPGCFAAALRPQPRDGDRLLVAADRANVELVLGFRPGFDLLVIETKPGERLLMTEEDGNAVIIDRAGRFIVIEGVKLAELRTGDIHVSAF